jgi:hypothetical protein
MEMTTSGLGDRSGTKSRKPTGEATVQTAVQTTERPAMRSASCMNVLPAATCATGAGCLYTGRLYTVYGVQPAHRQRPASNDHANMGHAMRDL